MRSNLVFFAMAALICSTMGCFRCGSRRSLEYGSCVDYQPAKPRKKPAEERRETRQMRRWYRELNHFDDGPSKFRSRRSSRKTIGGWSGHSGGCECVCDGMTMGDSYSMGGYSEDGWMPTDSYAYGESMSGTIIQDGTIIDSGQVHSAHCPHCEQQRRLQMQNAKPAPTPMNSVPSDSADPQYAPMPSSTPPMGIAPMETTQPMPATTPGPEAGNSRPPKVPTATEAFMAPTQYYNPPPHLPSPIAPVAAQQRPTLKPVNQGLPAPVHY